MWLPFVLVFSLSSVKSVGSGVGMLAVRTSSLLCALEKLGYGRLVLDSRNEAVPERLSASSPGIEDLRGGGALSDVDSDVEERAVGSGSGSLVELREGRTRYGPFGLCLFFEVEEEAGRLDFRFLVLLGLTGKNMAREKS